MAEIQTFASAAVGKRIAWAFGPGGEHDVSSDYGRFRSANRQERRAFTDGDINIGAVVMSQPGGTSPAEVARHLEGLTLPASKQDVVRHVRSKGANTDEITAVERLPESEFKTIAEILQGIGQVDAPG